MELCGRLASWGSPGIRRIIRSKCTTRVYKMWEMWAGITSDLNVRGLYVSTSFQWDSYYIFNSANRLMKPPEYNFLRVISPYQLCGRRWLVPRRGRTWWRVWYDFHSTIQGSDHRVRIYLGYDENCNLVIWLMPLVKRCMARNKGQGHSYNGEKGWNGTHVSDQWIIKMQRPWADLWWIQFRWLYALVFGRDFASVDILCPIFSAII